MPATYDFQFVEGNTLPFKVRFRSFDATGSDFVFRARSLRNIIIRRGTDDDGISLLVEPDPNGGLMSTLSWVMTPEESRVFGLGRVNKYEIERRIAGSESTLLMGYIIMIAGVNDDA